MGDVVAIELSIQGTFLGPMETPLSAAFLSAITAMRIAIHGRETTMPNLVGKDVSEASKALRSKGLILRVADRVYSDVPINQVVRQTPLHHIPGAT